MTPNAAGDDNDAIHGDRYHSLPDFSSMPMPPMTTPLESSSTSAAAAAASSTSSFAAASSSSPMAAIAMAADTATTTGGTGASPEARSDPSPSSTASGGGGAGGGAGSRNKKPIARACDRCHLRRLKCDGEQPCGRCVQVGITTAAAGVPPSGGGCTYTRPRMRKGPEPGRKYRAQQQLERRANDAATSTMAPRPPLVSTPYVAASLRPASLGVGSGGSGGGGALEEAFRSSLGDLRQDMSMDVQQRQQPTHALPTPSSSSSSWPAPTTSLFPATPATGAAAASDATATTAARQPQSASTGMPWSPVVAGEPHGATSADMDWEMMLLHGHLQDSSPPPPAPAPAPHHSGKAPTTTLRPRAQPPARPPVTLLASSLFFPSHSDDVPSSLLFLTLDSIVRPRIDDFLLHIQPMIPVFDRAYIEQLLADSVKLKTREHAALLLAMTALSLVHPLNAEQISQRPRRIREAALYADEALRLGRRWDFGQTATFEACMASYLLFGLMHEMDAGHGAKLRLCEAVTLGEAMGLDDAETYRGLTAAKLEQRMTLYWVLGVTERAHAMLRSGSISFRGSISVCLTGGLAVAPDTSIGYLARLFSCFDQDIIACWNGQCDRRQGCAVVTRERATDILGRLEGTPSDVFGSGWSSASLTAAQRADLLVTWQWLRNRMWWLAQLHQLELSPALPLEIALATLAICRQLPLEAMEAHGTGFVEKLNDIITIALDTGGDDDEGTLRELVGFVAAYRNGGSKVLAPLAERLKSYAR